MSHGLPFQNEYMICDQCGYEEQADPHVQSGWTTLDVSGERWYICPKCLGNPYFNRRQHTTAWARVLLRITYLVNRGEKPKTRFPEEGEK